MVLKILGAIIGGGIIGFIGSLFLASSFNGSDESLIFGIYFGVIAGLLIVLITEVNKVHIALKK